jgi:hypothetical protein
VVSSTARRYGPDNPGNAIESGWNAAPLEACRGPIASLLRVVPFTLALLEHDEVRWNHHVSFLPACDPGCHIDT